LRACPATTLAGRSRPDRRSLSSWKRCPGCSARSSTSVPGLAAKPIIDLLAATRDLDGSARERVTCTCWGIGFMTPGCPAGFLYRRGPASARAHHPHVVQASTLPTRNQVLLGDYLRGHPDDAAPGTAHSRDGSPRCRTTAATTPGQRPSSSRNSPTRRGPSAGSRRRQCGRSERCERTERCERSERCGCQGPLREVRLPR